MQKRETILAGLAFAFVALVGCAKRADQPASISQWVVSPESAGPIRVGMTADSALAALGHRSSTTRREGCEYLRDTIAPVRIMIVDDRVARFDVRDSRIRTMEGAGVGDSTSRIQKLYAGRLRVEPHKYTNGQYLVVTPGTDTTFRIIFETDSSRVTTYRAGRLPAVAYVEGCS
jgi:hypothetical protein